MDALERVLNAVNGVLWHEVVLFVLLGVGVLFTIWSGFSQYRALTHGASVIRGKYDDKKDPGAINHFQALSAALSATVGLGNIAGVAVAVALGGPGAVFWMWVVGLVGMALKLTEVTLAMLYRDTSDPDDPHGGPMWVAKKGFERMGLKTVGTIVGGIFCVTVIISAITGGNMFQAWSVAEITNTYVPDVPRIATGIVLALVVGMVIIGGIKRIGAVAGRLVPFMCLLYLLAAIYVLVLNIGQVPEMLALIVKSALPEWAGGESADPQGAFLGGTFAYAFLWGMKRALFSNEAGQGSSPIAHSAAKTDEPVREGIVAGLEPFIDTIVVCTITALVVLVSGAWNRDAAAQFDAPPRIGLVSEAVASFDSLPPVQAAGEGLWTLADTRLPDGTWQARQGVFVLAEVTGEDGAPGRRALSGEVRSTAEGFAVTWRTVGSQTQPTIAEPTVYRGELPAWAPDATEAPAKGDAEARISNKWRNSDTVFVLVEGEFDRNTGRRLHKLTGAIKAPPTGEAPPTIEWDAFTHPAEPVAVGAGLFMNLAGPSLTSHAFDRVQPGLGMYIVMAACWLFAISTMISWSYYGEQGVVYLFGGWAVLPYKVMYCALIIVSTLGFIKTDQQLDAWTALGTGVMLFANIPIMVIFGAQAMRAYHDYIRRLRSGELDRDAHKPAPISDVVEGKDVE